MAELNFFSNKPVEGVAEVEWLDFDYVSECKDVKIIEIIVKTLRAGTHGKYPELQLAAETKLASMQSQKIQSNSTIPKYSPSVDDARSAESELELWTQIIDQSDKLLRESSGARVSSRKAPPVRGTSNASDPNADTTNNALVAKTEPQIASLPSFESLEQYISGIGLSDESLLVHEGTADVMRGSLPVTTALSHSSTAPTTPGPVREIHTSQSDQKVETASETFTRVQITEESDDDDEDGDDDSDDSDDSSDGAEFNARELALADEKMSKLYLGDDTGPVTRRSDVSMSDSATPSESPSGSTQPVSTFKPTSKPGNQIQSGTPPNSKAASAEKAPSISDDDRKKRALALKEQGNNFKQAKNLTEALRCYTESVKLDPGLIASFNNRALVYIELKKYREAIQDCTLVLSHEPHNCKAWFRRAECYKQLTQYDKCESDLRQLFKLDPANKQARAMAEQVALLMDARDEACATASGTTTGSVGTQGKPAVSISSTVEKSLEQSVSEARATVLKHLEQGQTDRAVALCRQTIEAIQADSSTSAVDKEQPLLSMQTLLITSLFALGDYAGAVDVCDRILSTDPKHFRATLKKAEAQFKLGVLEEALNTALAAADIEPRNPEANRLLEELRRQLGERKTTELNTARLAEKQAASDKPATPAAPSATPSSATVIPEPSSTGATTTSGNNSVSPSSVQHTPASERPTDSQIAHSLKENKDKMRAAGVKAPSALLRSVTECKEKGNQHMAQGAYPAALVAYSQAIVLCESSDASSSVEPVVKLSCYYNRAQAFIKSGQYLQAQLDADAVVRETDKLLLSQTHSSSSGSSVTTTADEALVRLNKNALYVKGLALRNLGGDKLEAAEKVFESLLAKDSADVKVKKELEKVRDMLKRHTPSVGSGGMTTASSTSDIQSTTASQQTKSSPHKQSTSTAAAAAVAPTASNGKSPSTTTADGMGLTAVKTVTKVKPTADSTMGIPPPTNTSTQSTDSTTVAKLSATESTTLSTKPAKRTEDALQELVDAGVLTYAGAKPSKLTTHTVSPNQPQSPLATAAAATSKMKPTVPAEPPKTVYELERIWRGLKSHPELFAVYLSGFKPSTFKTAFKESVSPDLISSMLTALRDHCTEDVIVRVLTGFQHADGFHMTVQLLPEDDLKTLQALFVKLQFALETNPNPVDRATLNSFTMDQLSALRKAYKL